MSKGVRSRTGHGGSLTHIRHVKNEKTTIRRILYHADAFSEEALDPANLDLSRQSGQVQWIDVDSFHDQAVLDRIGACFGLHPLVLEAIRSPGQRPKIEYYDDYVYIVLQVLYYDKRTGALASEQESLILGGGLLLSFGERENDVFRPVIERLRVGQGHIRRLGADYLLYALLDLVVDNYFDVLEDLGERIETAEDELVSRPDANTLGDVHRMKRQMLFLHKAVWPLREVIGSLSRGETPLVGERLVPYLRDLHDHAMQVMDTVDTLRDVLSSILDVYLSSNSNRMNEIMKVLTIISTVFMPLSFIVGLYGMNLMIPEARWPWMYPVVWAVLLGIAGVMLYYFKKKKWW